MNAVSVFEVDGVGASTGHTKTKMHKSRLVVKRPRPSCKRKECWPKLVRMVEFGESFKSYILWK
jgi:hypothetical protein